MLHREWVNYYGKNPELIKREVLENGKVGWIDEYDETLTAIATIRSYQHIQVNDNFFPEYKNDIVSTYGMLDQNFIDRYYWFSRKFE